MKHITLVFGTRPEAIKLAPVIERLRATPEIKTTVCVFRQQGSMLSQTLKALNIKPDLDLKIEISDRTVLGEHIGLLKKGIAGVGSGFGLLKYLKFLKKEKPDLLIVQGDTSTAYLSAWLAFHFKIKIAHVEAGLRTYDKYAPFPEEMNRQLLGRLADIHFAPTEKAKENLLKEGVPEKDVHVVGNTAIDALLKAAENIETAESQEKMILVTAHRRESFGQGLKDICKALKEIAEGHKDIKIIYPVHANPNVSKPVQELLKDVPNIELTDPVDYKEIVRLMKQSYLILTDSGGIQEEAPSLGKPVLVMREETEREEGVKAGVSKLVGTDKEKIIRETEELLENKEAYEQMARTENPYGDGKASEKIVEVLSKS
ncbi:UDP-N-acetylglucosamine 2-epimerase (non-hydrolyzing) [bacterium]|nr:UDP-N-acetylglucosamine 2-epimerase (non-hydrolyzing) [bacterium]